MMISTDFAPYEKYLKIVHSSARSWFILVVLVVFTVAVAVSSADVATSLPILLKLLAAACRIDTLLRLATNCSQLYIVVVFSRVAVAVAVIAAAAS